MGVRGVHAGAAQRTGSIPPAYTNPLRIHTFPAHMPPCALASLAGLQSWVLCVDAGGGGRECGWRGGRYRVKQLLKHRPLGLAFREKRKNVFR